MNTQTKTANIGNLQAILDEINDLLETSNGIDEARAKKVRKAINTLRNTDSMPPAEEDQPADDHPAIDSELDAKVDAALEMLRVRIHKQVERRNHDYEKARQLLHELETTLKENELQPAERAYHKLMSIMGNIPGLSEQRWRDIEKRLNRVRPRLRKLESWRHWGTTQARQELINQVTQLKNAGLQPENLAVHIKQAREQWQAWEKSGDHSGKDLWKKFDRACKEAYKPCVVHFEKLRKLRAENLRQRQAIIEGLNAHYASTDWKHPDWREIDKITSQTRGNFYKIGHVDNKHRKPLARALDEALEKFEDHLSSERERSLRARERLITDIEALGEVANLRDALERIETLKKQWTITVTCKRELENKLWKRFQTACDSIYQRRDAERKEQAAERDENLKHKQALIEELTQAAAASDVELLTNVSALARISQQWETIGWVPRKDEKTLENRWRAAQQLFSSAQKAAESRIHAFELDNLAKRAALCNQWEQAILAGSAIEPDTAEAEWDTLPALTGANAAAIQQRFSQALSRPDDTTLSSNLATKQAACLKLEVLLELESPGDWQTERMAYKVERLNASMKKELGAQDLPEDLLLAALATGAVPAEAAGAIERRIEDCLARFKLRK
jgi:exonuclease SbcC